MCELFGQSPQDVTSRPLHSGKQPSDEHKKVGYVSSLNLPLFYRVSTKIEVKFISSSEQAMTTELAIGHHKYTMT